MDDHYLIPADKSQEKIKIKQNVQKLKNLNMTGIHYLMIVKSIKKFTDMMK